MGYSLGAMQTELDSIRKLLCNSVIMIITEEEDIAFNNATQCDICDDRFDRGGVEDIVSDHCYMEEKYSENAK